MNRSIGISHPPGAPEPLRSEAAAGVLETSGDSGRPRVGPTEGDGGAHLRRGRTARENAVMTDAADARAKPVIAVYSRYYLSISMTFLYRQLLGVRPWFTPIMLTTRASNLDMFPYEFLSVCEKSFMGRVYNRLYRMATGSFGHLTPIQIGRWRRLLRERGARMIHAHFGPYGLDTLPLARSLGIPMIVTFHGFDASKLLKDSTYVKSLAKLFEYAYVLTASEDFAQTLRSMGADPDRLQTHYIGVPVETFPYVNRIPPRERVSRGLPIRFLQISNFVEKKGHPYTVEAFSRFVAKHPNSSLVLAGGGPLAPAIQTMCRERGIGDKVRFTGKVTTAEVATLMSEADVFLHHSVTASDGDKEATTTVIAEAMSTGLIVIGTNHGGIPEMISDDVNGFLVEERDVDAYVSKMEAAARCGAELGMRASATVKQNFNLSVQNAKLKDIYERTISGKGFSTRA